MSQTPEEGRTECVAELEKELRIARHASHDDRMLWREKMLFIAAHAVACVQADTFLWGDPNAPPQPMYGKPIIAGKPE